MSDCILEYRHDNKMELDAIKQLKLSEIIENNDILTKKENAIKAVNSVILLKECIQLYEKCLKNICDKNTDEYNRNRTILEEKINSFNSNNFIRHIDFRLSILKKIYPDYKEEDLINKAQIFQTGDIIPFERLPYRLTELLSGYNKNKLKDKRLSRRSHPYSRRAKGKKNKIKTKKKINFKKLRKHITQRFKTRSKFKKNKNKFKFKKQKTKNKKQKTKK